MKLCILGDTHIGARNDNVVFHAFFRRFYHEVLFPYLREHGIVNIIQLGDLFDRRKYINFLSLKLGREYFLEPLNDEFKMWTLIGNHDMFYKNTNSVNSLDLLLGEYTNINVINKPTELTFDDVKILAVPWMCNENHDECTSMINTTTADVIVGHFEIAGFEMYRGAICHEGTAVDAFSTDKMVLSGHFHHRSHMNNIHYVGTPYEMTWSDYGDIKGFHVYDTDTKQLEFVPSPLVMFHKLHYNDDGKTLRQILDIDFSVYNNTMVKVIVHNKDKPQWFDAFIEKLEQSNPIDVQVVDDHLNADVELDEDIIDSAEDTLSIIKKYVDQLQYQGDRARLDRLINSLYSDALSMQ